MAKLTEQLDSINTGKRIVAPAENGPSFLTGLAKFAQGAGGALDALSTNERQQQAADQSKKIFEQNQGDRSAVNETAKKVFDLQEQAAGSARSGVPQQAVDAAKDLARTQRGVTQGRVAQEQMQLQLEKTISDLHQQHPDSIAAIDNYLHDSGFEHYLFRDQKMQDKLTAAEEQGSALGRAQATEYAVKNGLALDGMTPEQVYQRGADAIGAAAYAEMMSKRAQAERDAKTSAQGDYKFTEGVNDRSTLAAINAQAGAVLGSVLDVTSNLANGANNDDQYKLLAGKQDEINQGFDVFVNHTEQRMWAAGATKEMVQAFREGVDTKKKAVNDIFFGPSSRFAQTHRSFTQMQEKLQLSTVEALPVYNMATRLIGQAGVTQIFGGDMSTALSPEFVSKLRAELKAYDPTHPNQAINLLYQAGQIIKGDTKLQDLPESKVTPDLMRTLNGTAVGAAKNILDPEPDSPQEFGQFRNSLGSLAIAALRIQPGNKDINALDWGIGAIANNRSTAVLDKMIKDPLYKNDAKPLMMETRAAASQILQVARTAVDPVPGQKLEWKNGHYQVQITQKDQWIQSTREGSSGTPTRVAISPNPNLQKQADTMNAAVNYLVNTAPHDESIPKGVTPLMLREHYATGRALPAPKKSADGKVDPVDAWSKSFNLLDETLGRMNKEIQDKIPFNISFKSPEDAAIRTVIGEAGGESDTGQKAVASVILNRAKRTGQSLEDVVLAHNQFEPWGNSKTAQHLMGISEDSPAYKKAAAAVAAAMSGEDPTNGATHFYAPVLQSKLGRDKPTWDNGSGNAIGNHLFFNLDFKG